MNTNYISKPQAVDLEWAYGQTSYQIFTGKGSITLRVGALHPLWDSLASESEWCIVSAMNPESRVLPEKENDALHKMLGEQLTATGLKFWAGQNVAPTKQWPIEKSYCILGINLETGLALATNYDQNALLFGRRHQPAVLEWT